MQIAAADRHGATIVWLRWRGNDSSFPTGTAAPGKKVMRFRPVTPSARTRPKRLRSDGWSRPVMGGNLV